MRALTARDPRADVERAGGGKALHLHALAADGRSVPAWAVVGTDVFDRFVESAGLGEELTTALSGAGLGAYQRLSARIVDAAVEDAIVAVIAEAYERAGGGDVAVRSSGVEEDALSHSFAGQFDSFLNVRGLEQVIVHVKRCWASAFAERATLYRRQHGLPSHATTMAVIVQRLVMAEKSGVLFTANPSNGRRHELVVSSAYGLGESLVAGAVDADTIVIDRATGKVRERHVGEKRERHIPSQDAPGCVAVEVPAAEQSALSLTDEEIAELSRVGLEIEDAFGAPQDVEWAIEEGFLWILQSRPVTTLAAEANGDAPHEAQAGQLRVWDNSNIIESYGDITSPLTFTFARHVYHQVYRWYCKSLLVPEHLLRDMDEWQANRLGYFNGRVYYNLLNWYRMQCLLPFAGMKRRMMELSMGVDEALSEELARDMRPLPHRSRATELAMRIVVSTVFTRRYFTSRRDVRRFLDRFGESFARFDALDYESMSAEDLYRQMLTLDRELLPTWGPMVALEAIILTSMGLLLGLTQRWLQDAPRWLYWNVGKPRRGVESAEPARRLVELAEMVLADPELERVVRETEPAAAYGRLAADGKRDFVTAVDDYIARYGYRSMNELKLEEPSMRDDISVFFRLLRSSLSSPAGRLTTQLGHDGQAGQDGRDGQEEPQDTDSYLAEHMGRVRRPFYEVLRRKAQASLAAREQVRFCRTRAFGLARRIFRALDRELVRTRVIEEEGDIFLLRLEELRGCFEGTISHEEVAPLIAMRKQQRVAHERLTAPSRFITRGPMYWNGNLDGPTWHGDTVAPPTDACGQGRQLHGVGCCPGRVEGEAKVLDAPLDVAGGVIVTYRTDPGWIAALPSASALLVERGSPLTHIAIVARELNVPTIVQIKNLTTEIQTGMRLSVNGNDGTVTILSEGTK